MQTIEITIHTGSESKVVDITDSVAGFCSDKGDGLVSIFVPHATAGVAIFEAGAGSEVDLLRAIDSLLPPDPGAWSHQHGTSGHGRDHVVPAIVSPSTTIPVISGRLQLGTWQSIMLVDTNVDNPDRRVRLSFLSG